MRGRRQHSLYSAIIVATSLLAACSQKRVAANVPPQPAPTSIAAPSPVAPTDQSVFTNHPRTVHFRWSPVPQAAGYAIEIDCYHCCVANRWCSDVQGRGYIVPNLKQAEYEFDFWGDQQGRWRVWAIDSRSQPGPKSAWSGFSFRAGASSSRTQ